MKLPIFPLPIFLLPNGITQLRIFEQRYLNMVKNVHNTNGFVIAYADNSDNIASWGSWVDIIDFDKGKDGMLNIFVRCKKVVKIGDSYRQDDDLLVADISAKGHWPAINGNERCVALTEELQKLFNQNDALKKLYPAPQFEQDDWVIARWIELLPVSFDNKQHFFHPNSFIRAVDFLTVILLDEKNIYMK